MINILQMTDDFPVDVLRKMCNSLTIGNKSTKQIIWISKSCNIFTTVTAIEFIIKNWPSKIPWFYLCFGKRCKRYVNKSSSSFALDEGKLCPLSSWLTFAHIKQITGCATYLYPDLIGSFEVCMYSYGF